MGPGEQSLGKEEEGPALTPGSETESNQREQPHSLPIPPEVLENLPEEQKQQIQQFFGAAMSMQAGMGMANPIAQKITPEHITDVIGLSGREVDLEYGDRRHSRLVTSTVAIALLVVLVVFGAFLVYLEATDLFFDVVTFGAAFVGGFGGGVGFANWRRR